MYSHVTGGEIAACRRGLLEHPDWCLRAVPDFWDFYLQNLARWRGLAPGRAEAHWVKAFGTQESAARNRTGVIEGVLAGAWAHIERDLPRSLARVHREHDASRYDDARFRADYLALAHRARVFRHASDLTLRELGGTPGTLATVARALLPPEALAAFQEQTVYPVLARRLAAFEAGARIASAGHGDMIRVSRGAGGARRTRTGALEITRQAVSAQKHSGARH